MFSVLVGQINKSGAQQVRALGSNVVTVGSQGKPGMQMATMGGKQTIVINKPGGGQQQIMTQGGQQIIRTAGGQQIMVMSNAGGVKTVQQMSTSQAGGEQDIILTLILTMMIPILALTTYAATLTWGVMLKQAMLMLTNLQALNATNFEMQISEP